MYLLKLNLPQLPIEFSCRQQYLVSFRCSVFLLQYGIDRYHVNVRTCTTEQALACFRVYQSLSDGYQPIHVFRYNRSTKIVFILAGVTESLEILVLPSGQWRFNDDET
jgi:hypothetical protein